MTKIWKDALHIGEDTTEVYVPELELIQNELEIMNNSSIKISKDAYNFENNILWFLLTLHYQKPSLGILGSLGNVQNGILYIRRQGVRPGGGFGTVEFTAKIQNIYRISTFFIIIFRFRKKTFIFCERFFGKKVLMHYIVFLLSNNTYYVK